MSRFWQQLPVKIDGEAVISIARAALGGNLTPTAPLNLDDWPSQRSTTATDHTAVAYRGRGWEVTIVHERHETIDRGRPWTHHDFRARFEASAENARLYVERSRYCYDGPRENQSDVEDRWLQAVKEALFRPSWLTSPLLPPGWQTAGARAVVAPSFDELIPQNQPTSMSNVLLAADRDRCWGLLSSYDSVYAQPLGPLPNPLSAWVATCRQKPTRDRTDAAELATRFPGPANLSSVVSETIKTRGRVGIVSLPLDTTATWVTSMMWKGGGWTVRSQFAYPAESHRAGSVEEWAIQHDDGQPWAAFGSRVCSFEDEVDWLEVRIIADPDQLPAIAEQIANGLESPGRSVVLHSPDTR